MSTQAESNIGKLSKSSFLTKPLVWNAVLSAAVLIAIDPPNMKIADAVGYLAASLVLATFCMRSMSSLRLAGPLAGRGDCKDQLTQPVITTDPQVQASALSTEPS